MAADPTIDAQTRSYFESLPAGTSDAQIASDMMRLGLPVSSVSRVTGLPASQVQSRFEAAFNPSEADIKAYVQSLPAGSDSRRIVADMARLGVSGNEVAQAMGLDYNQALQAFNQAQTFSSTYSPQDITNIQNFLRDNPNMSDAEIVSNMITFGVSPSAVAQATGLPYSQVLGRYQAVIDPLRPTQTTTPVTPITPLTPTTPTTTTSTTPTSTMPSSVVPTPAISPAPGSVPAIGAALPGLPTQPAQYITPGGATTEPPAGVTPFALPMLNMRNLVNQGVVPSYVAVPQSTPQYAYQPITQIGTPIF